MKIGVIGAGAWGTALAFMAAKKASEVLLYARDALLVNEINDTGLSSRLPSFKRPENLKATTLLIDLNRVDMIFLVLPTQSIEGFLKDNALPKVPIVNCAKGISQTSGKFISESMAGYDYAVLSGPSFADDVVKGLPTAVTIAASSLKHAEFLAKSLNTPSFRLYHTDDVKGVEIGGACKNVLAIASGIVAGLALGKSAESALISRGVAEITRFAMSFNANPQTLMGLSGLGDIILSCNSPQSRNFSYGLALGKGEAPPLKLAEGVFTASILAKKALEQGVEMPICAAVNKILQNETTVKNAISELLSRPQRSEK